MQKHVGAIIAVVLIAGFLLGDAVTPAWAQRSGGLVAFRGAPDDVDGYPLHRNYTPEDYGAQLFSQNWAVTQDDDGIIYVANPGGVLSYDGATWRVIPTKRQTLVRTLVSDASGTIFVGAYGEVGFLQPDSAGTKRFVSLVEQIDPSLRDFGHTWSSATTPDGVYFQSRRTLFRWDGEAMKTWSTGDETRFFKIFSVRDTLFVAQENVGLRQIVDDELVTVPGGERFADRSVTIVLPHRRRDLLVGTVRSDLYLRRQGRFTRFATQADPFFQENEVHDAVILPDGTYAFATLWGGVIITDARGRTLRVLDESAGLIDDDVKSLFVDRRNGLWMACEKGISRTEVLRPLSVYDERAGLDGVPLSLVRHDGTLHVGTSVGVFQLERERLPNGTVRPAFRRIPYLRGQAFSLLSTPWGLVVGTDRGVYAMRGGRVTSVGESRAAFGLHRSRIDPRRVFVGYIDGIGRMQWGGGRWRVEGRVPGLDKGVFFMEEDASGNLWAASAYSGLWWIESPAGPSDATEVHEVAAEGKTPQHRFRMAYLPDGGGLRIVTRTGVAAIEGKTTADGRRVPALVPDTAFTASLPPDHSRILNVEVAPDGDRWIFTPEAEYWLHDTADGTLLETPFASVPEFNVYASLAEAQGYFWVAREGGILRHVPRPDVAAPAPVRTLVRRVLASERDSLVFGGSLQRPGTDSTTAASNEAPAEYAGTDVADARPVRRGGRVPELAYADNSVRIEYAAPAYGHEANIEYRYRLNGFDDEWSAWTPETRKDYTNLPPGSYTFAVEARHPRVWEAEAATFGFRVLPPWYRTTWSYLLYGVLGVGLVAGLVQWRTAHLDRRKQWLEQVVTQRTAEVKEQARQLEVYNNELLRSNEDLQEAIEEKSKLLGVAAHDLKNPIFGIRALSEVLLEQADLTDNADRKLNLIRQSADETLRLINDLLASAASTAQTQLDVERIDVAGMAEWIAHGFHPQADRKDQRIHCSLPDRPCLVDGDKRKLREAMNNLISNAIKYSPYGSQIYVEVDRSSSKIYFHVRDEGPGLSDEDLQRMFAPFQRLTPSPTGDEGSSGLGLYIVKKVVELHDGTIEVETELGEGSTFTIILPAASASPPPFTPHDAREDEWDGGEPVSDDPASEETRTEGPVSAEADTNGSDTSGSSSDGSGPIKKEENELA